MTRFIAIVSGKGGVGKTTSALGLGSALNYFDKDVTVVDANMSTPNIGLYLGVPIVPISLHNVLQGKNHITESVYQHPAGTKIVPGSISINDLRNINPDKLDKVIKGLKGTTEIVLIDGAAGLGREAISAIDAADQVLVVTNPETPAVTDALKTIKVSQELGKEVLGVILTRVKPHNLDISVKNVETMLEKPVIGIIPEDKAVREAMVMKDVVVYTSPDSKAAIGYKKLAADLIGQHYEPDIKEKDNFLSRIFRKIGFRK